LHNLHISITKTLQQSVAMATIKEIKEKTSRNEEKKDMPCLKPQWSPKIVCKTFWVNLEAVWDGVGHPCVHEVLGT
jgi:hypothetical protein